MPLPTERTVTGRYVNPVTGEPYDGSTGEHYVIFEPVPDRWTDRQGNQILLGGGRVNLGADGSFAEDVVCTDVPDVLPEEGRLWRLRQYVGGAWAVQYLAVPAAPDALDITDALSVDVCGVEYVPVPGPPGPPGEPTQVMAAPPMSATSGSPGTVTISVTPGAEGQVLTTSEGQAVWADPSGGGSGGAVWGSIVGALDDQADLKAALDAKAGAAALADHIADTANPHAVTKAQVGLGSVDNTSDADKPVSSAQQAALDAKLNISGGSLAGPLSMSGYPVSDAGDPQQEQDLATKKYVDQTVAGVPSGASWGGITGMLDNQTDLKGALDSKLNTSGGAVSGSLAVGGHALGEATPASHRVLAWAYDPALAVNSTEITGGALYLVRVNFAADAEVTRLYWWVANQAGTPTAGQNHVGLYDSSGILLASAAVESVLTSPGLKSATIASQSVAAGAYCWVGLLFNATVPPSLTRASGWTGVGQAANLGLTPAEFRFAVNGTGRTQMPPSIDPAVNTAPDIAGPWVAVG